MLEYFYVFSFQSQNNKNFDSTNKKKYLEWFQT